MVVLDKILDSTTFEDVDEAFLFAKSMAKKEVLDNKEKEVKSTFWAAIVNILEQRLNIVQVRRGDECRHF